MNYSNDSRKKTEQHNKSRSRQVKKKGKVAAFRVVIMSLIIGMFAVVGAGLGVFIGIIKSSPDPSTINIKPQGNYTSFVYDDNGKEIASFAPADNREYATLDQIPEYLQNAVIATEDERFREHNGIDIKGIFRAIASNLKTGKFNQGASTITQQLIKNNVLTSDKKLTRKIQEQYLAVQIEKIYSKDEILEYYLNTIGLSQGVCGVQAAANLYFDKEVSDLSLTECVVLAVITQRPTYYDPIKNRDNNWDKVQVVLQKMEEQHYITPEEHAAALLEDPYDNIQANHQKRLSGPPQSYFVDALFSQLKQDLVDTLGITETDAKNMIYGDGLKIYSTQNLEMQAIADKYILDDSQYPEALYKVQVDYNIAGKKADGTPFEEHVYNIILNSDDEVDAFVANKKAEWGITDADTITAETLLKQPQPQASFVLMDYTNGQIKALCGGRGDKSSLSFNYVTQAKRQPGSTFKVLAAYAPAIDNGLLSPDSELVNERVTYKLSNNKSYTPSNWDGNYSGTYTVRQAIANSMNVLAVKTAVDVVGLDTAYDYLLKFGFTTLSETDKGYSLPLGGITEGVKPVELNAAYGTIANNGVYVKPVYYTKVEAADGTVLIDNTGANIANNSRTVLKQDTALMLTDMMCEVVDGPSAHTGGKIRSYFSKMPVAGKTGTTTDDVDLLFSGYTPYYVATIWTGYSTSQMSLKGAGNYHLKIWAEIMNEIHQNLPYKEFEKPATSSSSSSSHFTNVKICKVSGKLATEACEKAGEVTTKLLPKNEAPTEYCDVHEIIKICNASGKIAGEYCPEDQITTIVHIKGDNTVNTSEVCDIHGPGSLPEDNNLNPENPSGENAEDPFRDPFADPFGDTNTGSNTSGEQNSPTDPGSSSNSGSNTTPTNPEPNGPTEVNPNPEPEVDDEDSFAIPQY